jgi:hypothetical protein
MDGDQAINWHCNQCLGDRNHRSLYKCTYEAEHYRREERLLQCCGCDHTTLVKEYFDLTDGSESSVQYPVKRNRAQPRWLFRLIFADTPDLGKFRLINEIYTCIENECPRTALMGIRALLEAVMTDAVGEISGFQKQFEKFAADGHISKHDKEALTVVLDAGHAAVHRRFSASPEAINACLNIMEGVMRSFYMSKYDREAVGDVPKKARHAAELAAPIAAPASRPTDTA